jgi:hypothetical protein
MIIDRDDDNKVKKEVDNDIHIVEHQNHETIRNHLAGRNYLKSIISSCKVGVFYINRNRIS